MSKKNPQLEKFDTLTEILIWREVSAAHFDCPRLRDLYGLERAVIVDRLLRIHKNPAPNYIVVKRRGAHQKCNRALAGCGGSIGNGLWRADLLSCAN